MKRYSHTNLITFITACLFMLSVGLYVSDNEVYAADKPHVTYCGDLYDEGLNPLFKACASGFLRETEDAEVCDTEFTAPSEWENAGAKITVQPKDLVDSCKEAYTEYKDKLKECTDKGKSEEDCKKELRPPSSSSSASGSNSGTTIDGNNLILGPAPKNADISQYRGAEDSEHKTCGIEGFFGKTICGVMFFLGKVADASYYILSLFLKTPPLQTTGNSSEVYEAWSQLRSLSNIVFIIGFLIVVYSQVTGSILQNYTIKKIVPRIIITAILINTSYYICAVFIDISNIVGGTIVDTMKSIVPPQPVGGGNVSGWQGALSGFLLIGAGASATVIALLYVNFAVALPLLVGAVIAIATTLLMLLARQALIIVFIVISPLAFAAILLPNTKSLFDKWQKAFIPLLMLYPAVGLLYGGAYIAAITIQRVGAAQGQELVTMLSLGVQVLPLLLIPTVMKVGGGLLNRFAGITQNNSLTGGVRKKAEERAKKLQARSDALALRRPRSDRKRDTLRNARDRVRQKRMEREHSNEQAKDIYENAQSGVASRAVNDDRTSLFEKGKSAAMNKLGKDYDPKTKGEKYSEKVAGDKESAAAQRARAYTIKKSVKAHIEEVRASITEMEINNPPRQHVLDTAKGNLATSLIQQEAACLKIAESGDVGAIIEISKNTANMTEDQRETFVAAIKQNPAVAEKVPFLANDGAYNAMRVGTTPSTYTQTVVAPSIGTGATGANSGNKYAFDYSPASITALDKDAANEVAKAVEDHKNGALKLDPDKVDDIRQSAKESLTYKHLDVKVGQTRPEIERMAK